MSKDLELSKHRIFLAHSAATTNADIERLVQTVAAHWPGAEIVTGRDAFEKSFSRAGGWREWAAYVVGQKLGMGTAEPRYTMFVMPSQRVGWATSDIVKHALKAGRLCYALVGGTPMRVRSVQCMDESNKQSGWSLFVE